MKCKTITLNLTPDQADELYFAAGLLYMEYDDDRDSVYNNSIRKYNNSIDDLRIIIKDAIHAHTNTPNDNNETETTPCNN